MRLALIGLAAAAAALAADMQSGSAQESFFNYRYCMRGGGDKSSGDLNCAFNTWQQCIESVRGLGRFCTENPFWHGPRLEPTTQGRGRGRGRHAH